MMTPHLSPPELTTIGGTVAGAAAIAWRTVGVVNWDIDAAFIAAIVAGISAMVGGLARIWRAMAAQTVQIASLQAQVQILQSDAREHVSTIERQERMISQLGSTVEVLRRELDRRDGDGR